MEACHAKFGPGPNSVRRTKFGSKISRQKWSPRAKIGPVNSHEDSSHISSFFSAIMDKEDSREQEQTEVDLVEQAYVYVTDKSYPEGCSENLKWQWHHKADG